LELAKSLASWVFHQKGVLRVGKVAHHLTGEKESPHAYIINQDIVSIRENSEHFYSGN
jgi:hypothetical protein